MKQDRLGFYISHSYQHTQHYHRLVQAIQVASIHTTACLQNYSTTVNPILYRLRLTPSKRRIRRKICRRIASCQIFIVLLGSYYDDSQWMQYEVEQAWQKELPVMGVYPEQFPPAKTTLHLDTCHTVKSWREIPQVLKAMCGGEMG